MKQALMSLSNKEGLVPFAQGLADLGFKILSTGGTAKALQEAGVAVTPVSDVTGFPEILGGRVKTLHPAIHGGILAMGSDDHMEELQTHGIAPIDLVVVNLYPFEETIAQEGVTLAQAIENIDIGGPTMIRASAKNHDRVGVVVDPGDYEEVLRSLQKEGALSLDFRRHLALKAFRHTAAYDRAISTYLGSQFDADMSSYLVEGRKEADLRYGENPHQKAAFYVTDPRPGTVAGALQHQGKALSYNNYVDMEAAWQLANEFDGPYACAIIKHTNPCGVALGKSAVEAYERALAADPKSAFGGIIAINGPIDKAMAEKVVETFMEAVIGPEVSAEALEVFKAKENLRILEAGSLLQDRAPHVEQVSGGFLVQDGDNDLVGEKGLETVTQTPIDEALMADLDFAWRVCKHVKSNAIVVAKDGQTLGVGAGQMNRVGSCNIAFTQAGEATKGAVLASDAFFPFRDSIDLAADHGIGAIIQPGGSVRDDEVIAACNEHGIAMAFTGMRHFKH